MLDKKNSIKKEERAILVGLIHKDQTEPQVQEYLDELAFLAETAGAISVKRFTQKLQHPDSRTFVGKGKLEEIKNYVIDKEIDLVIFDDEISKDDLAKYNLIVVGLPSQLSIMKELNDSLPIPFDLETNATRNSYSQVTYLVPPDAAFGYVELLQSPWNADNFVITALGNTPEGVISATTALYDAKLRGQLAGNFAAISGAKVQTADTRLGLPLEDAAVTQAVVNPLEPQPEKVDLSTPTIDRPVWLLIAIQAVVVLIVVMVLLVFWSQWRRSRKNRSIGKHD